MEIAYIKVFTDALETWSLLSDEEVGRLVRALLEYQRTGQYPVLPGNERFLFHTCKAQIDRDNEKYRIASHYIREPLCVPGEHGRYPSGRIWRGCV